MHVASLLQCELLINLSLNDKQWKSVILSDVFWLCSSLVKSMISAFKKWTQSMTSVASLDSLKWMTKSVFSCESHVGTCVKANNYVFINLKQTKPKPFCFVKALNVYRKRNKPTVRQWILFFTSEYLIKKYVVEMWRPRVVPSDDVSGRLRITYASSHMRVAALRDV